MENLSDRVSTSGSKGHRAGLASFLIAQDAIGLDFQPLARAVLLDCIAHYRSTRRQWEESEVEYARVAERLRETSGESQTQAEADLAGRWEAWSNLAYQRLTGAEQQLIRAIQVWFGYSTSVWDIERDGYLWRTAGVAYEGKLYIATASRDRSAATLTVVESNCLMDILSAEPAR